MSRPTLVLAALALLTAAPASAQEFGGVRPPLGSAFGRAAPSSPSTATCRLSTTSVAIGINRALAPASQAGQRTVTRGSGGCRPLVSTAIVAGVNLGLGPGSTADQTVEATAPRGLLATTSFARGFNFAAGAGSAAQQRILSQIGR
jgi:hypothetical protein